MVSAGDFRNGMTFEMDGSVYQIIEFQHVKPGKGAAFVRTKIKNVIAGSVVERTFSPTEKFPTAFVERREMQYMYNDGDLYYFMDNETYEQIPISKDELSDNFRFVKENMDCRVLSYKGKVFGVEPPNFVELQITETDQAGHPGNGRGHQGPAVHRPGRGHPCGYPHRRVYGTRIKFRNSRGKAPGARPRFAARRPEIACSVREKGGKSYDRQ